MPIKLGMVFRTDRPNSDLPNEKGNLWKKASKNHLILMVKNMGVSEWFFQ